MAKRSSPILVPEDVLKLPLPAGVSGYELVDGVPVPVSPTAPAHGEPIIEIGYRIRVHLEEHGVRGRVFADAGFVWGLERDPNRLRGPDVSLVREERYRERHDPRRDFGRFGRFVPELAVEIDLAGGRKPDGVQRIADYLEAGVALVWAIHPRTRSATGYRGAGSVKELGEQDALEGEDVLPGFVLPLRPLFGVASGDA